LNKEKILENKIEKASLELEVEALKEILPYKEKMLNERIQILLERGFTLEEIERLTK
jgi:SOS response regulatory protein OraA/RecX